MYTEDDEKVTVSKDNSNNDYNDFYTSFNDPDDESNNKKKKSKKKEKNKNQDTSTLKDESDYSSFYDENDEDIDEYNDKNKNGIIKYIVIVFLSMILIVLIIVLLKKIVDNKTNNSNGDIELNSDKISLVTGNSDYISYKIINTQDNIKSSFSSSNPNVAIVDENGRVTAISEGEAIITIYYTIGGVNKEKKCSIVVSSGITPTPVITPTATPINTPKPTIIPTTKPTSAPTATPVDSVITLNLTSSSGSDGKWTNKDVTITVNASSTVGIKSIKYAKNCTNNCQYQDVKNNKITITNNGETKVKVVVTDNQNKTSTKEVTIKIDKDAPTVSLNQGKNIEAYGEVEVCAICSDKLSGCKQGKVCKKYTSSKSNQTLTVSDNAGNTKKSSAFNITIKKLTEPCVLSVSSDGTVKATLRESATYYGFNENYSGTNELSQKISIDVSKTSDYEAAGAKNVYYYVKNKNGSGGKCAITIIKECKCNDTKTTYPNCSTTCTYRSN